LFRRHNPTKQGKREIAIQKDSRHYSQGGYFFFVFSIVINAFHLERGNGRSSRSQQYGVAFSLCRLFDELPQKGKDLEKISSRNLPRRTSTDAKEQGLGNQKSDRSNSGERGFQGIQSVFDLYFYIRGR